MILNNACIVVTQNCNASCAFCYSPESKYAGSHGTKEFKSIIDTLYCLGCNSFVLTGGEPLLVRDILDICAYVKSLNCLCFLNTNGIKLPDYTSSQLTKYIDCLGIPIDSLDYDTSEVLGRLDSLKGVLKFLETYKKERNAFKSLDIKVSTVATNVNYNDIIKIGEILPEDLFLWKIYQFCNRGNAAKQSKVLSIDNRDFSSLESQIKQKFLGRNIVFASSDSIESSNFLVLPDGIILTPKGLGYQFLGNLENQETKRAIQSFWVSKKYQVNASRTYFPQE